MVKKPKKLKPRKPETEYYKIEIDEWEVVYSFIGREKPDPYDSGKYGEDMAITMYGKILSPALKKISKAQLYLYSDLKLEDHWKPDYTTKSHPTVGAMQTMRDKITLHMLCGIPPRLYGNILVPLASGKIKHVRAYGEKLRWGSGSMFWIRLMTRPEEE